MIKDLEIAIGYQFKNITLLQNALSHSSYVKCFPRRWSKCCYSSSYNIICNT